MPGQGENSGVEKCSASVIKRKTLLAISFLFHRNLPNPVKTQGSSPAGDSLQAEHVEFGKEKYCLAQCTGFRLPRPCQGQTP